MRPAELARDDTPHLPVLQHAVGLDARARGLPARRGDDPAADVAAAARGRHRGGDRAARSSGADSVLSVSAVPAHAHPMRTLRLDDDGHAVLFVTGEPVRRRINRRQDLPGSVGDERRDLRLPHRVLFGAGAEPCTAIAVAAYRMPARALDQHRRHGRLGRQPNAALASAYDAPEHPSTRAPEALESWTLKHIAT